MRVLELLSDTSLEVLNRVHIDLKVCAHSRSEHFAIWAGRSLDWEHEGNDGRSKLVVTQFLLHSQKLASVSLAMQILQIDRTTHKLLRGLQQVGRLT